MTVPNLLITGTRYQDGGFDTSTSALTSVSAGASNAKGTWVQMIASLDFDTTELWVYFDALLGAAGDRAIDIGIGAAASEIMIIEGIPIQNSGDITTSIARFPIKIPKGTRIAARAQNTNASVQNTGVAIQAYGGGFVGGHAAGIMKVETYGFNSGDSGGVSVDPGGTINTWGSWTDIGSVTSGALRALGIGIGGQNNTVRPASGFAHYLIEVGYGASPKVLSRVRTWTHDTLDNIMIPFHGCFPVSVPAGAQLKARIQSNNNDATDRLLDIILFGVRG